MTAKKRAAVATHRAVVYLRISQDPNGTAAGVGRQREDSIKLCEQRGWTVAEVVTDNDQSASRYRRGVRPGWAKVLELLDSGEANALVAYDLDRVTRQPRDLEDLVDRAEHGLPVVTVQGTLDLASPDGRAMARVLLAMAAKASDDTSRRVRRMKLDLAQSGQPTGGVSAFGWTGGTKHQPAEADAIREAARAILAGSSLSDVARDWTERGFRKRFTIRAVKYIVTNPRNAGLNVHQGEVIGEGDWEPILDLSTYERLRRLLLDPNRSRTPPRRTAFTSMFVCGLCGSPMLRDSRHGVKLWRCKKLPGYPRCGRVSINADAAEGRVTEYLLEALDTPLPSVSPMGDESTLVEELRTIEARRAELAEMFAGGELDRASWRRALDALQSREKLASEKLAKTERATVVPTGNIRDVWGTLTDDRRGAVLRRFIEKVTVHPAESTHSPVDDRIDITWRV